MEQQFKTEKRKLSELKAAEYNPRKALTPEDSEYQKIARSITEFGYVDPIIINDDGTIIGGHQRTTVLMDLGYEEVDVVVVSLDKTKEKALNIALNKITGEWDEVKLKDLLLDLDLGDYDISLTGFEQKDLTELVDNLAVEPEATDDDFDEEEALQEVAEPTTKRGDIWILGRHRLMCGDSTDESDMATLMHGDMADLIVTDPPYNVNYGDKAEMLDEYLPSKGHRNQNHILNDNMDNLSFEDDIDFEAMKKNELVAYLVELRRKYQNQTTVLYENKPTRNDIHPTMKPIALVGRLMTNSSKSGWNVLDLFGGSGSTLMAAEQLGRTAFLMELDEKFCDVIVKRWEDYTGQKAERIPAGAE